MESIISGKFLKSIIETVENTAQIDSASCLQQVGLNTSQLSEELPSFIPLSQFIKILEGLSDLTNNPYLGLQVGAHYDPSWWGVLGYVMYHSPTLKRALENAFRYQNILEQHGTHWELREEGDNALLSYVVTDPDIPVSPQDDQLAVMIMIRVFRDLLNKEWSPEVIYFAHTAPDDLSIYQRKFSSKIYFQQKFNGVLFHRHLLNESIVNADPHLLPILSNYLKELAQSIPVNQSFLQQVRHRIVEALQNGNPSLSWIAKDLGMSPRTMQRRLAEHHHVFKELVEDIRYQLSLKYLESDLTLIDISFLLGYSELSAFSRAFRRWTGQTPLEYKNRIFPK